ncbi:MAG: histidinol-phosphatase [Clostridia bacterium]|nr:histidinol-phosphatase [Clostridia bacterium]
MLSNLHTHTTFCDGSNSPEEMVQKAIAKGFVSLGFSGHAYTPFELTSCMKDEQGYIDEINRLKKAYEGQIEIYLGTEEDAFALIDRSKYEYIIGSLHFLKVNGQILPLDIGNEYMQRCFEAFDKNVERMAESYYSAFTDYLVKRRPDVVGHFDLIKKYDEVSEPIFLGNKKHDKIAKRFLRSVASKGLLFEVNTGAIARGYRTLPYPSEDLLYVLKTEGADITLTSDCHNADYLDCYFDETKHILYDVGFRETVILCNNKFTKIPLK